MKKHIFSLVVTFFALTTCCTAQSILENYVNAIGGRERIDSVKTAVLTGRILNQYTFSTYTRILKRDFKYRTEFSHDDGLSSVYCYNGSELTGTNKAAISMMKEFSREPECFPLFNKIIFISQTALKVEADEVVQGKKCNVLSFTNEERNISRKYFFDVETHLLFAEDWSGNPAFYENYQLIGGILFPMRMTQVSDSGDTITEHTEIILNPELPDDIFDCNPE